MHLRANCCFQIYGTHSYLRSVDNFTLQSRYDLDLASPLRIRIDLDPHSRVASPTMASMSPSHNSQDPLI